jgi:hypothetical protein
VHTGTSGVLAERTGNCIVTGGHFFGLEKLAAVRVVNGEWLEATRAGCIASAILGKFFLGFNGFMKSNSKMSDTLQ